VVKIAGHGSVGRPHLARALVEAGHVETLGEAFERLIGNRGAAYIPRRSFTPEQAIALVHRAGGVSSLAHPGKLGDATHILHRLVHAGLDAVEVYHSSHTPEETERMHRLARSFRLPETGGSDSHGPDGPHATQVGDIDVPDAVGRALKSLLAQRRRHMC
jgi:predicted metal-dependent phosphoesterase TrpH